MNAPYEVTIQNIDPRDAAVEEIAAARKNGSDPRVLADTHIRIAGWIHGLLNDEEKP